MACQKLQFAPLCDFRRCPGFKFLDFEINFTLVLNMFLLLMTQREKQREHWFVFSIKTAELHFSDALHCGFISCAVRNFKEKFRQVDKTKSPLKSELDSETQYSSITNSASSLDQGRRTHPISNKICIHMVYNQMSVFWRVKH